MLCDRYTDATFAYQGHGRGFDLQVLQTLEQWVQASPVGNSTNPAVPTAAVRQPDLTLWFDLPAATAAARLAGVRAPDKFEAEPQAFFERVAAGYAARCAQWPQRFERIDASLPLEQVWQQVCTVVQRRGLLSPT